MLKILCVLLVCGAMGCGRLEAAAPAPSDITVTLAPAALNPAQLAWNPLRARPATATGEMFAALPLPVGAQLRSVRANVTSDGAWMPLEMSVIRGSAAGGDEVVFSVSVSPPAGWSYYDMPITSPRIADGDAFALRVAYLGAASIGDVSFRYTP